MAKISKKQRSALRQIDALEAKRKREMILGLVSIVVMAGLIILYNLFTYQLGIIDPGNQVLRAILYTIAMVIAGYCGIMFMRGSKKKREIDGLRQSTGISRETLEAWKRGEYNE